MNTRKQNRALTELADAILRDPDLERSCEMLFNTFQEVIPFDRIGVALLDETGGVALKWVKSRDENHALPLGYWAPLKGSSLSDILVNGIPRILNDLEAYLKEHPDSDSTRKILSDGIHSSLTCPLKTKEGWLGFIFFSSYKKNTYGNAHVDTFELVAAQLTFLFDTLRHEDDIKLRSIKEQFFRRCIHDMSNALNFVSLSTQLLLRGKSGNLSADLSKTMTRIDEHLRLAIGIFEELRNYQDVTSTEFSIHACEIDLKSFLKNFEAAAEVFCERKEIRFTLDLDPSLPETFSMDGKRISQVLINLLSNAIKFSQPRTAIKFLVYLKETNIEFQMQDHGQGIVQQDFKKVFSGSANLVNVGTAHERSTGLGLSICKRIVEDHGGKIWFESEFGVGSQFFFSLPSRTPS